MTFWLDAHLDPKLSPWLGSRFKIVAKPLREIGLRDDEDVGDLHDPQWKGVKVEKQLAVAHQPTAGDVGVAQNHVPAGVRGRVGPDQFQHLRQFQCRLAANGQDDELEHVVLHRRVTGVLPVPDASRNENVDVPGDDAQFAQDLGVLVVIAAR